MAPVVLHIDYDTNKRPVTKQLIYELQNRVKCDTVESKTKSLSSTFTQF